MSMQSVVTFDLFSALLDSRTGGASVFSRLGRERGWPLPGSAVYDAWDSTNKQAQRTCRSWVPYTELARNALADTYRQLGLHGEPADDVAALMDSLPHWPVWPDVSAGLPALARRLSVGLLSNVDEEIFLRTRVAALLEPELVFTSERLGVYKPDPRIYERARDQGGGALVHVATSARDVRGALESGIPVVRVRRPGHLLDPAGPVPGDQVDSLAELGKLLDARTLR